MASRAWVTSKRNGPPRQPDQRGAAGQAPPTTLRAPGQLGVAAAVRVEISLDSLRGLRTGEERALAEPAARTANHVQVGRRLQAVRDDLETDPASEADHHVDDRNDRVGALGRFAEERLAELDQVKREAAQGSPRLRAGTELN